MARCESWDIFFMFWGLWECLFCHQVKRTQKGTTQQKNTPNRFWTSCWNLVSKIGSNSSSCVPNMRARQWIEQKFLRFEISTCEHFLWPFNDFIGKEACTSFNNLISFVLRMVEPVADPGGCNSAYAPLFKKSKKNSFLAIFEGFWAYRPLLCVSYYWECPWHLEKVGRNSYKPLNKQGFT